MTTKKTSYSQIEEDFEYEIPVPHTFKAACCDCGCVHEISIKLKGKDLFIKVKRNDRSTSQIRRNKNATLFHKDGNWKIVRNKKN